MKANKDGIDPIEDALLYLEAEAASQHSDPWTKGEIAELKRHCKNLPFGESLYRAMIAHKNNWTHRGGRADVNQIEQWQREYESILFTTA